MLSECLDDFYEYDLLFDIKRCPACGAALTKQSERYDIGEPYDDVWWECPECGYCMSDY